MSSWQERTPKSGTEPEEQLWSILKEMDLSFDMTVPMQSFSIYPLQADVLVESVLAIEVQGTYWHSKSRRHKKDVKKKESFEAMGLGYLDLWDDELEKASQVKAGIVWRPLIKEWIAEMLAWSRRWNGLFLELMNNRPPMPMVTVPGMRSVQIDRRRE